MSKKEIIQKYFNNEPLSPLDWIQHPIICRNIKNSRNDQFIEHVKKKLDKLKDKSLLTRQESADLLNISLRQIDKLKADGEIRYVEIKRSVRFRKKDLVNFIKKNTIVSDPFNLR